MRELLVISIIATDSPGLAESFSRITSQNNCNIEDSRMAIMGSEFSASMLISGTPDDISACLSALTDNAERSGQLIISKKTHESTHAVTSMPYAIHTLSLDAPGIISKVTDFLHARDINISNLVTNSYHAPHTGAPMLEIQLTAHIPAVISISRLREDFADYCDELQIDAAFDPIK